MRRGFPFGVDVGRPHGQLPQQGVHVRNLQVPAGKTRNVQRAHAEEARRPPETALSTLWQGIRVDGAVGGPQENRPHVGQGLHLRAVRTKFYPSNDAGVACQETHHGEGAENDQMPLVRQDAETQQESGEPHKSHSLKNAKKTPKDRVHMPEMSAVEVPGASVVGWAHDCAQHGEPAVFPVSQVWNGVYEEAKV